LVLMPVAITLRSDRFGFIVLPGGAVPEIVKFWLVVIWSLLEEPVSGLTPVNVGGGR
jgi:hypothetical protein